mmetsp:Transcript_4185/g.8913  ORF Transcript_4185/g.8913 Transcript_4185/m.8913 type:complete len:200 (+) Transcript_4185:370-969(+)
MVPLPSGHPIPRGEGGARGPLGGVLHQRGGRTRRTTPLQADPQREDWRDGGRQLRQSTRVGCVCHYLRGRQFGEERPGTLRVEVFSHRRGPPAQERGVHLQHHRQELQHGPPTPTDGDAPPEQPPRAVGASQLSPPRHLLVVGAVRRVVQPRDRRRRREEDHDHPASRHPPPVHDPQAQGRCRQGPAPQDGDPSHGRDE